MSSNDLDEEDFEPSDSTKNVINQMNGTDSEQDDEEESTEEGDELDEGGGENGTPDEGGSADEGGRRTRQWLTKREKR